MRELKFRVYIPDYEKFRYFTLGNFDCSDRYLHQHSYTVQQYTGLTDRNGVEVYEGDIVRHKDTEEIGVVYFAAGTFMIDGGGPLYEHVHGISPDILEDYVVIGNTTEDSELLK